jgi:hypothetical protein
MLALSRTLDLVHLLEELAASFGSRRVWGEEIIARQINQFARLLEFVNSSNVQNLEERQSAMKQLMQGNPDPLKNLALAKGDSGMVNIIKAWKTV